MKCFRHKNVSIYLQMFLLMIIAGLLSLLFFLIVNSMSEYVIDQYMENSNYEKKVNLKKIEELQAYITVNHLLSRDYETLKRWVQEQKLLSLSIYKDGIMVFDSDYPDREIWQDEIGFVNYDWMSYDTIVFSDGLAEIQLTGAYIYQFYNTVRMIEMGISFLLFLLIALLGLRRKMAYIKLLCREVEVLETGSLNYHITVKGRDELSLLAAGLESMRRSFLESREKEENIVQRNQRIITEMSHDLRTPVTTILLYTEIILNGKAFSAEQEKIYLEKIRQKTLLVKERTDRLLEYSLKAEQVKEVEMAAGVFADVFYELLSEFCGYLEQNGFQTEVNVQWSDRKIWYQEDYIIRIMDNITSNIMKYADTSKPVIISITESGEMIRILIRNHVDKPVFPVDSTGIGLQNIENLMKKMGGEYKTSFMQQVFQIELSFPAISDPAVSNPVISAPSGSDR